MGRKSSQRISTSQVNYGPKQGFQNQIGKRFIPQQHYDHKPITQTKSRDAESLPYNNVPRHDSTISGVSGLYLIIAKCFKNIIKRGQR